MPKSPPQNEPETRERILRATIALIAEVGADRVRTRAIAERAGVNPALVHYHFGSMSALIAQAVETVMTEESQPFIDALERGPSVRVALESLFEGVQGVGEPTPGLMVSIDLLVRATRDPKTRSWVRRMLQEFRVLILARLEAARRAGEIDPDVDLTATAAMIAALLDGLGMHRLIDRKVDAQGAAAPLFEVLFEPMRAGGGRKQGDD